MRNSQQSFKQLNTSNRQEIGTFVIATDSFSVVTGLQKSKIKANTLNSLITCKNNVYRLKNNYNTILWILAHQGIIGNEQADVAAKQATIIGEIYVMYPKRQNYVPVCKANLNVEEMCQERWNKGVMGRYFYSICPIVNTRPWYEIFGDLSMPGVRTINRLASNHYKLNYHFNRINIIDGPLCPRCSAYETADHIILVYPTLCNLSPFLSELVNLMYNPSYELRAIIATYISVK